MNSPTSSNTSNPPPPPHSSSITHAFLFYCILPIAILILTNTIAETNEVFAQWIVVVNPAVVGSDDDGVAAATADVGSSISKGGGRRVEVGAGAGNGYQVPSNTQGGGVPPISSQSVGTTSTPVTITNDGTTDVSKGYTIDPVVSTTPTTTSTTTKASRHRRTVNDGKVPQNHHHHHHHSRGNVPYHLDHTIDSLRMEYKNDPSNIHKALTFADALFERDRTHHDGGSIQHEAISTYQAAIQLLITQMEHNNNNNNNTPNNNNIDDDDERKRNNINEELFLDLTAKSTRGLLLHAYSQLSKQYFMANMFESSVQTCNRALQIEPTYIDALVSRAGSNIVLGNYVDAGIDYDRILQLDRHDIFTDVYSNISRILVAKKKKKKNDNDDDDDESVFPGGWDRVVSSLDRIIPMMEEKLDALQTTTTTTAATRGLVSTITNTLKILHLVYFAYYDHETQDTKSAWMHLQKGNSYKVSNMVPFDYVRHDHSILTTKQIFTEGFWPDNVGSQSRTPIFIIGFPRSGSTLLERVLDSHPLIVGTGEDSVFNGMLGQIRNAIVDASMSGSARVLQEVVKTQANKVLTATRKRWEEIDRNTANEHDPIQPHCDANQDTERCKNVYPKRFTDKMLHNYMNVGFIHLLFPNSLILHTSRNPMDTLFSAFKYDFPPGSLDHTSDFKSLSHMYRGYRDIIDHWDRVLPGRVTHVRYEDMVDDMPGIAKAVIGAARLPWDPDVLNFHKKKHAVNTHSTTQVRKPVYKDSVESWRKYETQLQPLLDLIGPYAKHSTKTTLKGYKPRTL